MPYPTIPGVAHIDIDSLVDSVEKMRKYLMWILQSLDTLNVKELSADVINTGILNADLVQILSETSGISLDSSGITAAFNSSTRVEINQNGLTIYDGALKVYDDTGATTIIEGGTFYGDNMLVTGNIWIGEDIYMNADYVDSQNRYIYPFQNDTTIYVVFAPGATGTDPTCQFIGFNEVYIANNLTAGGTADLMYAYENGSRLATRTYCDGAVSDHEGRCINYATA